MKTVRKNLSAPRRLAAIGALTILSSLCVASVPVSASAETGTLPFGVKSFTVQPTRGTVDKLVGTGHEFVNEPYSTPFTQAGGHPWGLTTTVEFATREESTNLGRLVRPTQEPKDVIVNLPPGLLGDPMAVPRCPLSQVTSSSEQCPPDTQVGVYLAHLGADLELLAPIVNVTPEAGQSAEFALENTVKLQTPLLTAHLVRTANAEPGHNKASEYGFSVVTKGLPVVGTYAAELTFWGVPGDPSHDPMRGLICKNFSPGHPLTCQEGGEHFGYSPVVPFLTMSTDCSAGPETATLRADSWEEPGSVGIGGRYSEQWKEKTATLPGATGCGLLSFAPSIAVEPETLLADEPAGLGINVKVPLPEKPESLAAPQLRDTLLTLPEGMSVSPGVVDGIRACEAEGPEGIDIEGPESETVGLNGELQLASGHCPEASTVGTAEAVTPLLPIPVKGHVYLAKPGCGGAGERACTEEDALDGNLYRLYLELGGEGELAQTGVHFKVPMETEVNPATGQLTTRVLNTPQAPFSELKVHLNGDPRAPIANPVACESALTSADFTPWSAPGVTPEGLAVAGTPDATPSSFYDVQGCSSPPPFNPGFTAGTVTPLAGQFSSFTMNLSREDREQYVKGIQLHTPPGLLGMLSSVPLCQEPAADDGTCPPASKIGTTRVATGAGSHPFEIEGEVFLTGPYQGAPFGLSIVVHVIAGPFNLGVKVVRARIAVSPQDSTLTVTTDESGPYAVPQIVFGVPVRLRRVTVNIDRPGFMFNPTNCKAQQIVASLSGSQGATAGVASPFAVGACKSLAFRPHFTAATSGQTSRAKGASLDVKLFYPKGALGADANIAEAKVSLPRQLPSRLTTLQKACPAATFGANPAACTSGSIVGIVRASTPLLPVGLAGPAYFVSHGGEAFPSLVVVLEGDGVRVDLTGTTFISKAGITSTTFKTVPDVPVDMFELYLPQGRYSALAANGKLCRLRGKLKMPTMFLAQNGAVFKQSTGIAVGGCKATTKAVRGRRRAKAGRESGHGGTGK
jgi:hypothetical protein